jgi:taurine--2-oxoglutarate transaminase
MGKVLRAGLVDLAEKHPSIGDIRGVGLLQVTELVKNRDTREPLSPFNKPMTDAMKAVAGALKKGGVSTFVRWNMIFHAPPLVVTEAQVQEALAVVDKALDEADKYVN